MSTTLTSKGQVTIPKHIRDALQLLPGAQVEFAVNAIGDVVLRAASVRRTARRAPKDRFEAALGQADVPWRTDALMKLLRAED
jgi:antitoxin PrlF